MKFSAMGPRPVVAVPATAGKETREVRSLEEASSFDATCVSAETLAPV